MKRLLAVALLCAVALSFATMATAAVAIQYKTVGPIPLCVKCGNTADVLKNVYPTYGPTALQADSVARNFNTAAVGGSQDTSVTVQVPDIVWGAIADSLPLIVVVERVSGTGGSTDSVQVALQGSFGGGGAFLPAYTDAGNDWGGSTFALVGAGNSGAAFFWPATTSVTLEQARLGHHIIGPVWGAREFRIVARSVSAAASAGRFSVFLRYPVIVR